MKAKQNLTMRPQEDYYIKSLDAVFERIVVINILYRLCMRLLNPTLDLHLFMMSMNSFLPIPAIRKASAALKLGMLS